MELVDSSRNHRLGLAKGAVVQAGHWNLVAGLSSGGRKCSEPDGLAGSPCGETQYRRGIKGVTGRCERDDREAMYPMMRAEVEKKKETLGRDLTVF